MYSNTSRTTSEEIYKIVQEAIHDDYKIKNLFARCFDTSIYDKMKKHYEVKEFFEYLRSQGLFRIYRDILTRINSIIASNTPNYSDEIDQQLELIPMKVRNKYSIDTMLQFTKKILDPQTYAKLVENTKYIRSFDDYDNIFISSTGRDYEYFYKRYEYYRDKKYIRHVYEKWKAPKFTIVPPTRVPATLQKVSEMISELPDRTLNEDKDTLRKIFLEYNKNPDIHTELLFSLWEKNMYKYLTQQNIRPRSDKRNALLAATVWLHLKKTIPLETIIPDESLRTYVHTMYNKLSPSYFAETTQSSSEVQKIVTAIADRYPEAEYSNIRMLIGDVSERFARERPRTKKAKEDLIYGILKPQLKGKVTRDIVKKML